jgi:hypothetical protein
LDWSDFVAPRTQLANGASLLRLPISERLLQAAASPNFFPLPRSQGLDKDSHKDSYPGDSGVAGAARAFL